MEIRGTIKKESDGGHTFKIPAFDCHADCGPGQKPEAWIRDWVVAAIFAESRCKIRVSVKRLNATTFLIESNENKYLLGLMLATQRRKHDVSLRALADMASLSSHAPILRYEKGHNEMSLSQFEKLLATMGLKVEIGIRECAQGLCLRRNKLHRI